jgi:hypothetical protein
MVSERGGPAQPPKGVAQPVFDDRALRAMWGAHEAVCRSRRLAGWAKNVLMTLYTTKYFRTTRGRKAMQDWRAVRLKISDRVREGDVEQDRRHKADPLQLKPVPSGQSEGEERRERVLKFITFP